VKVDGLFIKSQSPDGRPILGLECSQCGQRFFDELSAGPKPVVLQSAVEKFVDHANDEHKTTGGVIQTITRRVA
jgi:hypothetical protein